MVEKQKHLTLYDRWRVDSEDDNAPVVIKPAPKKQQKGQKRPKKR